MTKYAQDLPEYKGVFSPTITVNVTHKSELDQLGTNSLEDILELSRIGTAHILKDFKVVKSYSPYRLSNCDFFEYDTTYTFEHIELKVPVKVELKVIKAVHGDFYYDFNCHQSTEAGQTTSQEFETFKQGIRLI